jgi:hypothetical protein
MTSHGEPVYLVSNFREALSILENLRASSTPGRGMRHLHERPVVEALRGSEAEAVTGGVAGEFPVLCRVDRSVAAEVDDVQQRCVPLSGIQAFVFRTGADRDQFAGKMFENVSVHGRMMAVVPELFVHPGPPRFQAGHRTNEVGSNPSWARADALAGAAGAVLALSGQRPEIAQMARCFFLGEPGTPVTLAALAGAIDAPDGPWVDAGTCAGAVAFRLRSARGQDPLGVIELFVSALGAAGYAGDILDRFREYVAAIITDRRPRRSQDLADSGDLLLRSLLLFVQRDRLDEILDDTADGLPPGQSVHLAAVALGGLREGVARMPSALKSRCQDALGDFASAIETDPTAPPDRFGAQLAALLPPEPASPPPSRSIADLVRQLEASASALGLGDPLLDDGIIGSCSEPPLVARIAALPADDGGRQHLALLVSVGEVEDDRLLREALKGTLYAQGGSFLWLPDGANRVEVAFLIDKDLTDDLPKALARNVEVVRRWLAASAASAAAPDETLGKARGGATGEVRKRNGRKAASGGRGKRTSVGKAGTPDQSVHDAAGHVQLEPAIAESPAPATKKRASGKRSTKPKSSIGPVQEELLADLTATLRPAGEQADKMTAARRPDATEANSDDGSSRADGTGQ